jgi:hypothetical protein
MFVLNSDVETVNNLVNVFTPAEKYKKERKKRTF